MNNLQQKIQKKVADLIQEVEEDGYANFSVAKHSNWDNDYFMFQEDIIAKMKKQGYNVTSINAWKVITYTIKKSLEL